MANKNNTATAPKINATWLTIIVMAAATISWGYEIKTSVSMNTLRHNTVAELTDRRLSNMEIKVDEIQKVISHLDVIENKINNITRQLNKYSDSVELLNKRALKTTSNGNQ